MSGPITDRAFAVVATPCLVLAGKHILLNRLDVPVGAEPRAKVGHRHSDGPATASAREGQRLGRQAIEP
jgi:hypothetical protein